MTTALAVLATASALGLVAALWWMLRRLDALAVELTAAETRAQVMRKELAAQTEALQRLLSTQQFAERAVEVGTTVVKEIHQGIAAIPFSVLENIPATRDGAKVVRKVHDAIAGGIYSALSGLNAAVGRELRKGLSGDAAKPAAPLPEDDQNVIDVESTDVTAPSLAAPDLIPPAATVAEAADGALPEALDEGDPDPTPPSPPASGGALPSLKRWG